MVAPQPSDDYVKWERWAYEQIYGPGSWDRDKGIEEKESTHAGFQEYHDPFKVYWSEEHSVGVLERDGSFVGVACLVAKEVVDKENFVRKFGLSFEKDIQWKAASSLLDHLSRSPLFKAVLVTINKLPFKLEVDEAGRLLLVSDVMKVPMILTTRDHIVQIQKACERILGREKAGEAMYQSGFESGHDFASALAAMSGLKGEEILEEYLRIASVRGWGRFETVKADASIGLFIVRIHTSIVEEFPPGKGKVCHIWRGSFAGVVQAILESLGKTGEIKSEETRCMADGDPYCEIQITVKSIS